MSQRRLPTLFLLVALVPAAIAATAAAQSQSGPYFNVKYGETRADASIDGDVDDLFDRVIDGEENSTAYELGWRFNNWIALQAGYHDFDALPGVAVPRCEGEAPCLPAEVPIQAQTQAFSLAFVPQIPLGKSFRLFLKVGLMSLGIDLETVLDEPLDAVTNISDEELMYGAGLRVRLISGLSIFYEYEVVADTADSQYLGASWQF